ncbi:MAG: hypothetical protein ABIA47_03780 [bacterium]
MTKILVYVTVLSGSFTRRDDMAEYEKEFTRLREKVGFDLAVMLMGKRLPKEAYYKFPLFIAYLLFLSATKGSYQWWMARERMFESAQSFDDRLCVVRAYGRNHRQSAEVYGRLMLACTTFTHAKYGYHVSEPGTMPRMWFFGRMQELARGKDELLYFQSISQQVAVKARRENGEEESSQEVGRA